MGYYGGDVWEGDCVVGSAPFLSPSPTGGRIEILERSPFPGGGRVEILERSPFHGGGRIVILGRLENSGGGVDYGA